MQLGGDEDLGADAVGRSDQCAAPVAGEAKEPGEPADRVDLIGMTRLPEQAAVALDGFVPSRDVDSSVGVTVRGRRFEARTRILPAFRHRLAVLHRPKGPPCKFYLSADAPSDVSAGALVVPFFSESPLEGVTKDIDAATGGAIAEALASGEMRGKLGEVVLAYAKDRPYRRVLAISLGEPRRI